MMSKTGMLALCEMADIAAERYLSTASFLPGTCKTVDDWPFNHKSKDSQREESSFCCRGAEICTRDLTDPNYTQEFRTVDLMGW